MIRFACPGCEATYTVGDEKGGKTGRCPKCQAQFVIPAAEGVEAPPAPPPPPRPPAPKPPAPPPAAPQEIEIAPCPGCQARLVVATTDLGADVECPHCQTVYTAARPAPAGPSRRSEPAPGPPPRPSSRRPADADEDRPSRRGRNRRPAEDEAEEDEDRPSRRRASRDDEDEDEDRPSRRPSRRPRRGKASGLLVGVGVVHILASLLHFSCGGCSLLLGGTVSRLIGAAEGMPDSADEDFDDGPDPATDPRRQQEARQRAAERQQQVQKDLSDAKKATTILMIFGVVWLVTAVLMVVASIGCFTRKKYGRLLTYVCGGLAALYIPASIVSDLVLGGFDDPGKAAIRVVVGLVIWGGYAAFVSWGVTKESYAFE